MHSFTPAGRRLPHTGAMLRLAFLITALALPIALVYAVGFWALAAAVVAVAALLLFSSRQARGSEDRQGGRLTGYRSTELGDL